MITPAQCKAARELLGWSWTQLARASGALQSTILVFELGTAKTRPATFVKLRTALEAAGIEFIPENGGGPGVRLRKDEP